MALWFASYGWSLSCALDRDRTAESNHHAIAVCLYLKAGRAASVFGFAFGRWPSLLCSQDRDCPTKSNLVPLLSVYNLFSCPQSMRCEFHPYSYHPKKLFYLIKIYAIAIFAPDPNINTRSGIICRITDLSSHQTVPETKIRYSALASVWICVEANYLPIDFINWKLRVWITPKQQPIAYPLSIAKIFLNMPLI